MKKKGNDKEEKKGELFKVNGEPVTREIASMLLDIIVIKFGADFVLDRIEDTMPLGDIIDFFDRDAVLHEILEGMSSEEAWSNVEDFIDEDVVIEHIDKDDVLDSIPCDDIEEYLNERRSYEYSFAGTDRDVRVALIALCEGRCRRNMETDKEEVRATLSELVDRVFV